MQGEASPGCQLTIFGRSGEVTGSCHLIECGATRVLLECGLFQGSPEIEALNAQPFPFAPSSIDAVVLSHAHLDHSGLLPRLVSQGFRGPIYATEPTRALAAILWMDAVNVQQYKAQPALYDMDDVDASWKRIHTVRYEQTFEAAPGVSVCLHDAGHILGSATVELTVSLSGRRATVVFSGDLGNPHAALMPPPTPVRRADVAILESTYGDREHAPMAQTLAQLETILNDVHRAGGNVIIPCFAVARTQELLFRLGALYRRGRLPQQVVYLDSPLAIMATEIYEQHLGWLAEPDRETLRESEAASFRAWLPPLRYARTIEESKRINDLDEDAIILAGSGMCTGGRVLHHLRRHLGSARHHVVLVGFQAPDTLGRALQDGADRVVLFDEEQIVAAKVHHLSGFSAHAGQQQLLDWLSPLKHEPALYLVHGETGAARALQAKFNKVRGWYPIIPDRGVAWPI